MKFKTLLYIIIIIYLLLSPLILLGIIMNYLFENFIYPYFRNFINTNNNQSLINDQELKSEL